MTKNGGRIVTITLNPALDKCASIEQVRPNAKLRCKPPRFDPGGGGVNVARAIYRLGGKALALYTMGGPQGQMLMNLLDDEGGDHHPVRIGGNTRESLTVIEESTGQQYRFGFPGPQLAEKEWTYFFDYLADMDPPPDYVVGSGSLARGAPADFYGRLARNVRDLGGRAIIDTSGEPLVEAAEAGVYLLKPNIRELGQIAGRELQSDQEIEAAARNLIDDGDNEVLIVSMGPAGAMLVTGEGAQRITAPMVPIQSRIGAGDSMVGGITLALARGWDVLAAARFGVATGSAAVMTSGTQLCRKDDAERLYDQIAGKSC
jgi:6-phosphofructokinase 2